MIQEYNIFYNHKHNNNDLSRIQRFFRTDKIGIYEKNSKFNKFKGNALFAPRKGFADSNILQYCDTKRKDHSYVLHLPDQGVLFFNFSPYGSREVECFSSSFEIDKVGFFVSSHVLFFTVY